MRRISTMLTIVLIALPVTAYTDSMRISLSVKPSRCIALQQGQSCFADLTFRWSTPESGEFCLFDERQQSALVCWKGNSQSNHKVVFKSDRNVTYFIRSSLSEQPVAQTLVKISWVYKSNNSSNSRWRLF